LYIRNEQLSNLRAGTIGHNHEVREYRMLAALYEIFIVDLDFSIGILHTRGSLSQAEIGFAITS
jgi:hypothetical protein